MQAWKNPIVQKRLTGSVQNYEFMRNAFCETWE